MTLYDDKYEERLADLGEEWLAEIEAMIQKVLDDDSNNFVEYIDNQRSNFFRDENGKEFYVWDLPENHEYHYLSTEIEKFEEIMGISGYVLTKSGVDIPS